ncbi:YdbC family protein [Alkalihalobacterium chitinilyticum]|uniref:PC4/YdbC family ssDNA-binding protein n=1 Tax=Alkalihalobacterium chitinilyticum TaxID=2980103 RepID=A0ABT5V9F6_9BACI|nr:PC4/YdbC family ssDNA-binding protein [Alkalihalobacterium chitinilyticum]MDE5412086.1 PC4/YdbC family ssDNA-binding protein [Alkalihalobacterium chitinilyticum]
MAEIKFEIEKNIGVLSENAKGWKRELNLVSWNGREAKFDLRDWDPNHEKMGKGLTLSKEEVIELKSILNEIDV